jgi:protocatechuate 3,4-dioxygenase, beta subunit
LSGSTIDYDGSKPHSREEEHMLRSNRSSARREFLRSLGAGAGLALFTRRGLFAETLKLKPTASTGEGPFYPDKMPLDTDNDLLIINDSITPAIGEIAHLTGRVLTITGQPVRNAFVEIWQVDSTASYVHTNGRQPSGYDANFQGYGRFLTDSKGQYYFRTIKPISYTLIGVFRTAHIHLAISRNGKRVFTTQLLVKGHPDNGRDGLIKNIDPAALDTVLVPYSPMPGSKIGELAATCDLVLGKTLEELEDGKLGGVATSDIQRRRR